MCTGASRVNRGNLGKTGKSANMRNHYMQRIMLPQSVFSHATSVAASANYYTNQFAYSSVRGWERSLALIPGKICFLTMHFSSLSNSLSYFNLEFREDVVLVYECFSV